MTTYDEWRLAGPDDRDEIGHTEGETCGRVNPPYEGPRRNWRAKPCDGVMLADEWGDTIICENCGEIGD